MHHLTFGEAAVKHFKLEVALGSFPFQHFIDCKSQKGCMSRREALSAAAVATSRVVVLCLLPCLHAGVQELLSITGSRGDFRMELHWRVLGASSSHRTVQCHLHKFTGSLMEAGYVTTSSALARTWRDRCCLSCE